MRSSLVAATLVSFALAARAEGQAQPVAARTTTPAGVVRRTAVAVRYTGPAPKLDGVLDDPAWAQARPLTDFVQRTPHPGAQPTVRTEGWVVYDDAALWVAVRAHDPHPDSIVAPVGRRDLTGVSSDWIHLIVDSYADRRTGFRFSVNPAGVQKDALESNDTNEDLGWDAVWQSATRVDSGGWTVEYRIPLSQLRFSTSASTWGFEVIRDIARRSETDDWSPVRPDVNGFVSQFGDLGGITGLHSGRRLELVPYTLARLTRAPDRPGDPFYSTNQGDGGAGADVKYGLTSNLTLTATINPDFGQVEADPSQVNLTAFETFFPEKRPFFTEGAEILSFNVAFPYAVRGAFFRSDQPFYSRRVGRAPQLADPPAVYEDRPASTTILGAAKVSGQTANGWSIGVLDALTAREQAQFVDTTGARQRAVVEPATNYLVARTIKTYNGGQSAVGALVTAVNRDIPSGDPRMDVLARDAMVAGVDGRTRFDQGHYEARASVLGSWVRGSTDAISRIQLAPGHFFQRPDATDVHFDSTRTALTGFLMDARVEKTGGGHLRGGLYAHARSPGLEMNDVGFEQTTDWVLQGAWIGWNHFEPGKVFRNWNADLNGWNGWNFGGERLTTGFNVNGAFTLNNNWSAYFGSDTELPAMRTDYLRGGPSFIGPAYSDYDAGINTDPRSIISGDVWWDGFNEWSTVGRSWDAGTDLIIRAGARMRITAGPSISRGRDPWIFVAAPKDAFGATHYVAAEIHRTSVNLTTRMSYAFTPRLTLDLYAQPFVATGAYSDLKEVTAPHAPRFDDRFTRYGPALSLQDGVYYVDRDRNGVPEYSFGRPDFDYKSLISNLVLRWEYRPGSTVYVVWSQGRENTEPDGTFRFGRDFGRLLDGSAAPSTNVLLVKFSYWFNL